jgi:hypothetical protein
MDFVPQGFIKHGSEAYVTKGLGAGSLEVDLLFGWPGLTF